MKIITISGSHRQNSNSLKVAKYFSGRIEKTESTKVSLIELARLNLPVWSEDAWNPASEAGKQWEKTSEELASADGFVFVVPEWGGMAPPLIKNFLLYCTKQELSHKPVLLCGVSSGIGGTYPLVEMRLSSHKNNQMVFLPEQIIVRNVNSALNEGEDQVEAEAKLRNRIEHSLGILQVYCSALRQVRDSNVANYEDYPFGM